MLSIVFCCSFDLFLGFLGSPCFMRPKSLLSSFCSSSTSSKTLSPLFIHLKICNAPLSLINPTEGIFKSLKL